MGLHPDNSERPGSRWSTAHASEICKVQSTIPEH
jgi:hypothetical protein